MLLTLVGFLKRAGFNNVFEADDGKKALNIIEFKRMDLIISDWSMPNLNGFELLVHLKSHNQLETTRFIMVTSYKELDKITSAIDAGVSDYIIKPIRSAPLIEKIHKVFLKT